MQLKQCPSLWKPDFTKILHHFQKMSTHKKREMFQTWRIANISLQALTAEVCCLWNLMSLFSKEGLWGFQERSVWNSGPNLCRASIIHSKSSPEKVNIQQQAVCGVWPLGCGHVASAELLWSQPKTVWAEGSWYFILCSLQTWKWLSWCRQPLQWDKLSQFSCFSHSNSWNSSPRLLQRQRLKHYSLSPVFLSIAAVWDHWPDVPVCTDLAQVAWGHHETNPNRPCDLCDLFTAEHTLSLQPFWKASQQENFNIINIWRVVAPCKYGKYSY